LLEYYDVRTKEVKRVVVPVVMPVWWSLRKSGKEGGRHFVVEKVKGTINVDGSSANHGDEYMVGGNSGSGSSGTTTITTQGNTIAKVHFRGAVLEPTHNAALKLRMVNSTTSSSGGSSSGGGGGMDTVGAVLDKGKVYLSSYYPIEVRRGSGSKAHEIEVQFKVPTSSSPPPPPTMHRIIIDADSHPEELSLMCLEGTCSLITNDSTTITTTPPTPLPPLHQFTISRRPPLVIGNRSTAPTTPLIIPLTKRSLLDSLTFTSYSDDIYSLTRHQEYEAMRALDCLIAKERDLYVQRHKHLLENALQPQVDLLKHSYPYQLETFFHRCMSEVRSGSTITSVISQHHQLI